MDSTARRLLVLGLVAALAGVASAGPFSVTQPYDSAHLGDGFYADATSSNATYYYNSNVADNFTLPPTTGYYQVSQLEFWGCSENYLFTDLTNFSSWQIEFYSNSGGVPGTLLGTATVPKASCSPVQVGTDASGSKIYKFTAAFPVTNIGAGGNYFVCIGSVQVNGLNDAWVWHAGLNGNNSIAYRRIVTGGSGWGPWGVAANTGNDTAWTISGTEVPGTTLTGTITLDQLTPDEAGRSVVFTLVPVGGGSSTNVNVTLGASGSYSFSTTLSGNYNVYCFGTTFLRKVYPSSVNLAGGTQNLGGLTLINGDCDHSNIVDLGDFDVLADTFGLESGDAGFDLRGDLNQDSVVDLGDFDILSGSFGSEGDWP